MNKSFKIQVNYFSFFVCKNSSFSVIVLHTSISSRSWSHISYSCIGCGSIMICFLFKGGVNFLLVSPLFNILRRIC